MLYQSMTLHKTKKNNQNGTLRTEEEVVEQKVAEKKKNKKVVCVVCACAKVKLCFLSLKTSFGCWNPEHFPKRCNVAELQHIAYNSDNDLVHIGIMLLCEVFAPSLLNMHECLK